MSILKRFRKDFEKIIDNRKNVMTGSEKFDGILKNIKIFYGCHEETETSVRKVSRED